MMKHYFILIAITVVSYFIGVIIGMIVTKQHYGIKDSAPIDADFDDILIQHVGYDSEQCGYEK